MKRFLLVFLLVISGSLVFSAKTIPNPTTSIPRERDLTEVVFSLVCYPNSEYDDYSVWEEGSYAVLVTEEFFIASSYYEAEHLFYTEEERIAKLERHINNLKITWCVLFSLISNEYPNRNYIQIGTQDSEIIRVLMINDEGDRVLPSMVDVVNPKTDANGNYTAGGLVFFPKQTLDGKPIIHENTKWVQFWLFTTTERICFQYDFYQQE